MSNVGRSVPLNKKSKQTNKQTKQTNRSSTARQIGSLIIIDRFVLSSLFFLCVCVCQKKTTNKQGKNGNAARRTEGLRWLMIFYIFLIYFFLNLPFGYRYRRHLSDVLGKKRTQFFFIFSSTKTGGLVCRSDQSLNKKNTEQANKRKKIVERRRRRRKRRRK